MDHIKIDYTALTDVGCVRENNEDNTICKYLSEHPNLVLIGVIDGVGGYTGGEVAAEICKTTIETFFESHITEFEINPKDCLTKALLLANTHICEQRQIQTGCDQMSCVATFGVINALKNKVFFAHIGDSRVYVLGEDLVKISNDHSFVGRLEDQNLISEEEALKHPKRNMIDKALGLDFDLEEGRDFQTGFYEVYKNDLILFCTDGLTDLVDAKTIWKVLQTNSNLEEKAARFISLAKEKGGKDNITVALAVIKSIETIKQKTEEHIINPTPFPKQHLPTTGSMELDDLCKEIKNLQLSVDELKISQTTANYKHTFLLIFIVLCLGYGLHGYKNYSSFEDSNSPELIPVKEPTNNLTDSIKNTN